jgi:hypothetical protein
MARRPLSKAHMTLAHPRPADTCAPEPAMSAPDRAEARSEPVYHPCPRDPSCPYCNGSIGNTTDALDWSFLDAAYCISLKTRDDRVAEASAQFHKVGLCQQVVFYRPDRHPEKGFAGSWQSHRIVGMHALERGCARTLIFEDDVVFDRRLRPRTLSAVKRALDTLPTDWTIFFLGHWPLSAYFVGRNVLRTSSACSHAYIASSRLLHWLRDHPWGSPGVAKSRLAGKGVDGNLRVVPDDRDPGRQQERQLQRSPARKEEKAPAAAHRHAHRTSRVSALEIHAARRDRHRPAVAGVLSGGDRQTRAGPLGVAPRLGSLRQGGRFCHRRPREARHGRTSICSG